MLLGFLLYYSSTIIFLIPCVSAGDSWDDFANNLATDLAPLITLFGDQITKQFLSESISFLDNFIFCLAPLGVLTAVVSAIRVCGNSSLRAFIGRGQEDPGSAERELLSCVSDSTAEVFSNFGVSRITGNPAILEVVVTKREQVDGSSQLILRTVRQASGLKDAEDPVDHSPNLMLNKGIKRRSRYLFYAAAQFGILLQLGLVVYAALTVFMWPDAFRKDGNRVASYAFPFFVFGTSLLSIGMFSCAWLIEQSSYKRYYKFDQKSSIYWIQPGAQEIGDQVYEAFAGKSDNRLQYIQSVRFSAHPEQSYRRLIHLVVVVCCSMIGFIFQFVGLRGLHSSVILGQLGSTMLMTVVRTALRTERINESDNLLINERALISKYRQELDWFTFHLHELKQFNVKSEIYQLNEIFSGSPAKNAIETRNRLADLTTSIPVASEQIRTMASNLAKVMEATMFRVSRRSQWNSEEFSFPIPIQCEATNAQSYRCNYKVSLCMDRRNWKVNSAVLESILGLNVWSLVSANRDMEFGSQSFRVFDLGYDDPPRTRRIYYKWVSNEAIFEQREPLCLFTGSEKFGAKSVISRNVAKQNSVLAPAEPDLVKLAAQELFSLFLMEALKLIDTVDGNMSIEDQVTSFRGHYDLVQDLKAPFVEYGLGSERDALLCVIPELEKRNLLPELTMANESLRKQVENLIKAGNWIKAIDLAEWMLALSEPHCLHSSSIELGYVLLRGLLEPNDTVKEMAADHISKLTQSRSSYPGERLKVPDNVKSPIPATWWQSFREQLLWLAWSIAQYEATFMASDLPKQILQPYVHCSNAVCSGISACVHLECESAQTIWGYLLRVWFDHPLDDEEAEIGRKTCLDWLLEDSHNIILEWLMVHYIRTSLPYDRETVQFISMIQDSTKRGNRSLMACLAQHESELKYFYLIWDLVMERLVRDGDIQALKILLERNDPIVDSEEMTVALFYAAESDQTGIARYILEKGVDVNVRNRSGETLLMTSAFNKSHAMVELLLENGADVNATSTNFDGETALMVAARHRNLPLLKYLLDHGADVHLRDDIGRTALDIARVSGHGPWTEGIQVLVAAEKSSRSGTTSETSS